MKKIKMAGCIFLILVVLVISACAGCVTIAAPMTSTPTGGYIISECLPSTQIMPIQFYTDHPEYAATLQTAMNTWNNALPNKVFGAITITNQTCVVAYDGKNEIVFAPIPPGELAITYQWPMNGKIVEVDMVFNSNYQWNTLFGYDLQNMATHEFGHVLGLNDLYGIQYWQNTMYGYVFPCETFKDTLAPGDIYGAQLIYGAPS